MTVLCHSIEEQNQLKCENKKDLERFVNIRIDLTSRLREMMIPNK